MDDLVDTKGHFPVMPCFPYCVESGEVGVVQRFGQFRGVQDPGLAFYACCLYTVQPVSLAVRQIACRSDCKTKDNVTLSVTTAVQYRLIKDMVQTAVFQIADPTAQMRANVDNVLRSTLPELDLDEAYLEKDKMVASILASVKESMGKYGYEVLDVLITDLQPEASVLMSMNEINASRRQREAAIEKGEADKIIKVKNSEADAEAKRLAGVGMAQMRSEIAKGFRESMRTMEGGGLQPQQTMQMMMMTQYLDTMKEFSATGSSVMIPHGPGTVKDIEAQIANSFSVSSWQAPPAMQSMSKK